MGKWLLNAGDFCADWRSKNKDKDNVIGFWTELMERVYGLERASRFVTVNEYWESTKDHDLISLTIPSTNVAIIQLSQDGDVSPEYIEPGIELSAGQRIRRWAAGLPKGHQPRMIVVSNQVDFCIYDEIWGYREPSMLPFKQFVENRFSIIPFTHISVFKEKAGIADIWDDGEVSLKVMQITASNFNCWKPLSEDNSVDDDFYLTMSGKIVLLRKDAKETLNK